MKFCRYVDEVIFNEENRGSTVRFVVDEDLMRQFCKSSEVSESDVMKDSKGYLYYYNLNILELKGLLAIQTYAACKLASGNGYTARNFRQQLSMLLNWDINYELQPWMVEHQENYWERLYIWCIENDFSIPICLRTLGKGRYTQYPLRQIKGVFTVEELKYIACAFVDKGLHPDDDLTYDEFWNIVYWEELNVSNKYLISKHARQLYATIDYKSDALQQIYGYFNRWDGEYLERKITGGSASRRTETSGRKLYLDEDLQNLIVADKNMNNPEVYSLCKLPYKTFQKGSGSRKKWIMFSEDNVYGGWQEVHSLELGEEGRSLIWEVDAYSQFGGLPPLISYAHCKVYRVTSEDNFWRQFYANQRPYRLEGGLKVSRDTYLFGGTPILKLDGSQKFWVDNNHVEAEEGRYDLSYLGEGRHEIRIRGYKPITINIVTPSAAKMPATVGGWHISRRDKVWTYHAERDGVRGMDFTAAGVKQGWSNTAERPVLETWARLHHGTATTDSNNIAINTLKNICVYE